MTKVLVIRLSSFGDVALLAPVIYSVASRYPQVRFEVMTRQAFVPIFNQLGFNISVLPIDTHKKHKGVLGLLRIVNKMLGRRYTHVADVHDVLRTKVIRFVLRGKFAKVRVIDKGRDEKDLMTQTKNTNIFLKHATERYMEVFHKLGFHAEMIFENLFDFIPRDFNALNGIVTEKKGDWIGIAPFAQHQGKIYPPEKTEKVIEYFSKKENTTVFLFGGGKQEIGQLKEWERKYSNVKSPMTKLNLHRELLLISYLDVMLSMDSANMHLASLVEVPVVSIWGATHPALGFYGFRQDVNNVVQLDMDCRPCSVFGNKPCQYIGDDEYKCLRRIDYLQVIEKIEKVLEEKKK